MEPTRALRLVVIVAALLLLAGGWPAPEAAAQPARPVAAQPPTGSDTEPPGGTDSGTRRADQAAGAARARAAAAEQQARAAAAEARRVAQLAANRQRVRATWESRGRPARLVIVRDVSLDIVTQGRLTRRTPRRAGPLNLTTLSRYLPSSWLSIDGGTATLTAAVVLTPRVVLDIGGDVTTVKLTGGATLSQAASIYTGSGRILLHGVTITSADPASGQPLTASPGRPFLVVTSGGRLDASDVTATDLGTSDDGPRPRSAIQFNPGSTGSVVRSTFTRNSVGLQLDGSQDVRIEDVAVTESLGHGLATSRDSGTVLRGIRAERNGGNGIRLNTTTTKEPITGVSTAGNGRFGIAAIRLRDTRIEDMRANGDAAGGLELSQSTGVTVSGFAATDEPAGVYAVSYTHLTLPTILRV